MATSKAVIVLTPNGRRQTVQVELNTPLLKILEDVCKKHKMFDPNKYDLKHHQRILDLTATFRFAGVPNNSLLEMVEAQKERQDSDIDLVIHLNDGSRLSGLFKPNTKIAYIVGELCPAECTNDAVIIFMRTEIPSCEFHHTTLKDLGLLGGRTLFRLIHRGSDHPKFQAKVALNLQPKQSEPEPNEDEALKREKLARNSLHSSVVKTLEEEKAFDVVPSTSHVMDITDPQSTTLSTQKSEETMKMIDKSNVKTHSQDATEAISEPMVEDESEEEIGEIHILGERNAVLFTLNATNSAKSADLPDSFFDLSVQDIKLLIKDLRTESEGTVDQPMLTSKMREMQEEQNQLSKLNRYKAVIIRVQFPNRYVLQGTFTPYETIEKVVDFVRPYLINADIKFHLYTTPPKNILADELRLFEAECVPSAVLHFGCEDKQSNYLKESVLDKGSSPTASLKQAALDRGLKESANTLMGMSGISESKTTKEQRARISNSFKASTSMSTSDAKLPKWLKSFGK